MIRRLLARFRRRRSYSEVVLSDSPLAYFPLDDASGPPLNYAAQEASASWMNPTTKVNVETMGIQCPVCGVPVDVVAGFASRSGVVTQVELEPCNHLAAFDAEGNVVRA